MEQAGEEFGRARIIWESTTGKKTMTKKQGFVRPYT